jgi:hypothetical protein
MSVHVQRLINGMGRYAQQAGLPGLLHTMVELSSPIPSRTAHIPTSRAHVARRFDLKERATPSSRPSTASGDRVVHNPVHWFMGNHSTIGERPA